MVVLHLPVPWGTILPSLVGRIGGQNQPHHLVVLLEAPNQPHHLVARSRIHASYHNYQEEPRYQATMKNHQRYHSTNATIETSVYQVCGKIFIACRLSQCILLYV